MDEFREFGHFKSDISRYSTRMSEDQWNRHKPTFRKLHEARLTPQEILELISTDFGNVEPTYGQLCTKFDKWGFQVHGRSDEPDTMSIEKLQMKQSTYDQTSTDSHNRSETSSARAFCYACGRRYENITINGDGTTVFGDVINHYHVYDAVEQAVEQALKRLLSADQPPETIRQNVATMTYSITESILGFVTVSSQEMMQHSLSLGVTSSEDMSELTRGYPREHAILNSTDAQTKQTEQVRLHVPQELVEFDPSIVVSSSAETLNSASMTWQQRQTLLRKFMMPQPSKLQAWPKNEQQLKHVLLVEQQGRSLLTEGILKRLRSEETSRLKAVNTFEDAFEALYRREDKYSSILICDTIFELMRKKGRISRCSRSAFANALTTFTKGGGTVVLKFYSLDISAFLQNVWQLKWRTETVVSHRKPCTFVRNSCAELISNIEIPEACSVQYFRRIKTDSASHLLYVPEDTVAQYPFENPIDRSGPFALTSFGEGRVGCFSTPLENKALEAVLLGMLGIG